MPVEKGQRLKLLKIWEILRQETDEAHPMSSVALLQRLEEIDIMAFWGCDKLESLSIPSTVKTIGASAFAECTSLRSVTIPRIFEDQIDEIFAGCNDLEITYID